MKPLPVAHIGTSNRTLLLTEAPNKSTNINSVGPPLIAMVAAVCEDPIKGP